MVFRIEKDSAKYTHAWIFCGNYLSLIMPYRTKILSDKSDEILSCIVLSVKVSGFLEFSSCVLVV